MNFTIAEPESSKEKATRGEDEPRVARQTACDAIWCATLTVDEQTGSFGWSSGPEFAQASLTDDRFNFAGNEYQLDEIAFRDSDNRLTLSFSGFNAGDIDSQATRIRLAVDIDGAVLNLGEGTYNNSVSKTISWTQDVGWSDGQTVQLKIVEVLGPILSISPSASPIKEARNAKATFTVTRSHLTSGYTTAHLGWSRTGNYFNCDYCGPATDEARQNEGELPLSPVFRPGETTRTVSFRVHEDYEFEQPGSVTLFLKPTTLPDNEYEIDPAGQSATVEGAQPRREGRTPEHLRRPVAAHPGPHGGPPGAGEGRAVPGVRPPQDGAFGVVRWADLHGAHRAHGRGHANRPELLVHGQHPATNRRAARQTCSK